MTVVLFAAIAPLILWPIEIVFPYPHIVEELAKAILVFFVLKTARTSSQINLAVASGFLFAISESVLYLFNLLAVGSTGTLLARLATTIPLHVTTVVLMTINLPIGLPISIIGHYFFNSWVAVWPRT